MRCDALVRAAALELSLTLVFVAGCGSKANDDANSGAAALSCEVIDASAPCSMPMPSFANDIFPMLQRDCNGPCHVQGGIAWPLTGYQDVSDWSFLIQAQVDQCEMPPVDAGALPPADRKALLDWIACGSPNN
jgi:hypothetical protein